MVRQPCHAPRSVRPLPVLAHAGDPLDFAGSDQAMPSTECCKSGTTYYNGRLTGRPTWGQPFELPTFGGPLVFPYNKSSFKGIKAGANLQLSTWTYCAISNGTISNWNDPAITADNGGKSVTRRRQPDARLLLPLRQQRHHLSDHQQVQLLVQPRLARTVQQSPLSRAEKGTHRSLDFRREPGVAGTRLRRLIPTPASLAKAVTPGSSKESRATRLAPATPRAHGQPQRA